MNHLKQAGIGTGIHYPIPLHLQKAYASLNYERGSFPVAERLRPRSSRCRCSRSLRSNSNPGWPRRCWPLLPGSSKDGTVNSRCASCRNAGRFDVEA